MPTGLSSEHLGQLGPLVDELLRSADREERRRLAEAARWFALATVGSAEGLDDTNEGRSGVESAISCDNIDDLFRFAGTLHQDAVEVGDLEQAADAIVLAAGLMVLSEDEVVPLAMAPPAAALTVAA